MTINYCVPRLTLIQISACERKRRGLMRMPACFLLGKQKADLQLADISVVTLHWQDRQRQQLFWKGKTRGSNVLSPSRSPHPSPPCERSSLSARGARVSAAPQGDIKPALSQPSLGFQCPGPCGATSPSCTLLT